MTTPVAAGDGSPLKQMIDALRKHAWHDIDVCGFIVDSETGKRTVVDDCTCGLEAALEAADTFEVGEAAARSPREPLSPQWAPGIDHLLSVNAALHAVQSAWRIDLQQGQAVAVPTPDVHSEFVAAAPREPLEQISQEMRELATGMRHAPIFSTRTVIGHVSPMASGAPLWMQAEPQARSVAVDPVAQRGQEDPTRDPESSSSSSDSTRVPPQETPS